MENSKILLVTQDQDLQEFLTIKTEAKIPFDVEHVNSFKGAKTKLTVDEQIKVVITDYALDSEIGKQLYDFNLVTSQKAFICIFDGQNEEDVNCFDEFFKNSKYNHVVLKHKIKEDYIVIIEDLYVRLHGQNARALGPVQHEGKKLCRVKTDYFLKVKSVDSDVFVRLPSGKFIKVIKGGAEISTDTIENIHRKGGRYLYQEEKEFNKLVDIVFSNLRSKLKNPNASTAEKIQVQLQSIKQVQDTVRSMGISESVIEFTDDIVDSVQDVLKSTRNLSALVKKLLKQKNYFFVQSSIMNYLLGGLVQHAGWDSYNTLKKLVYASVFCDFAFLEEQDHMVRVLSTKDPRYDELSRTEQEIVKNHPAQSAKMLERQNSFLTDEITIVLQHHEKPDGSGFPRGLTYKQIPPLSCAFILVYDFTNELIRRTEANEGSTDPKDILEDMGTNYTKANFSKPFHALKKSMQIF